MRSTIGCFVLGLLAASAMFAQQNQFQSSVPTGVPSSTPLVLTLRDAIDSWPEGEYGIAGQRLGERDGTRRASPVPERSAASVEREGRRDGSANQLENHRIRFPASGSLPSHRRWSVSLHECSRVRFMDGFRLQRPEELQVGPGEPTRRTALPVGCARSSGSSHGEWLSSDHRRRFSSGSYSLAGGNFPGPV
jgi:hypothetical protein